MAELSATIFFRNRFVPADQATLSVASAPVLYGLSMYTVFPVFWDEAQQRFMMFRLPDHFRRLQNSAKILAFDDFARQWTYEKFEQTMTELLKKNKVRNDCLVRVSVFVDDILQGTRMHGLKHSLTAFVYTAPGLPATGAKLCVSSWRRTPDNAIPARAKVNGGYVNAALMKHEAVQNGFDDAVALDEAGHVTESSVSNIFMVRDGQLITPAASSDLLEGITRDTIFRLAEQHGLKHHQRAIDRTELYIADEIFLCGTSLQIVPVISLDHRTIGTGKPGPITKQLMNAYAFIKQADSDWLTTVV